MQAASSLIFSSLLTIAFLSEQCYGDAQNEVHHQESKTIPDDELLKNLVHTVKMRLLYGEEVAIYKYLHGEPILDKAREKAVMDSVAKMATELGKSFGDDEYLFFIDLMEGTKVIEYALISQYNAKNPPKFPDVSLDKLRSRISAMQPEIIDLISRLQNFKYSENCQVQVAKSIANVSLKRSFLRIGMQRAFGNFCKKLKKHSN